MKFIIDKRAPTFLIDYVNHLIIAEFKKRAVYINQINRNDHRNVHVIGTQFSVINLLDHLLHLIILRNETPTIQEVISKKREAIMVSKVLSQYT